MAEAFLICGGSNFLEKDMWKLVVGFIVFAALALYMLSRGGDIDLSGEKHGVFDPRTTVNPVGAALKIS